LKKLKNLRNKFYKRFLVTQDPGNNKFFKISYSEC